MHRIAQIMVVVLLALICDAYRRRDDEVDKNSANQKHKESKRLSPHEAAAAVVRSHQLLKLSGIEVGGSGCEEVTCKARQMCVSHTESGKVACIRKKLLLSRSPRRYNKLHKILARQKGKQLNHKPDSLQKKLDRMKKDARQFERQQQKRQQKRLVAMAGQKPLVRIQQALVAIGDSVSNADAAEHDVVCRRKQLEGLGRRLLDHFKQQYEQKKKKRKEKRNSTKKELREDDECRCQSVVSWEFQQLDTDFDGHLSDGELRPLKPSDDNTEAACVTRFTVACDHDKDGTLSEKEWCCCFADVLPPCMAALKKVPSLLIRGQPSVAPGAYVPQCDDDGFFRPLQCHASTGQCWCVDHSGHKLTTTSGSVDC